MEAATARRCDPLSPCPYVLVWLFCREPCVILCVLQRLCLAFC